MADKTSDSFLNKSIRGAIKMLNLINLASSIFLIILCIFPYNKVQNITLYVFFISYLFEFLLEKRWENFKWNKTKWFFVSFLLFYVLIIAYYPFEETHKHVAKLLEYRLPFLAFGVIGFFGLNKLYRLKYFAYAFLSTSMATIVYLLFIRIGFSAFIDAPSQSEIFKYFRIEYVNAHMIYNYYLNITLAMSFYVILRTKGKYAVLIKSLVILCMIIVYYILLLTEGRQGFITANVIVLVIIFYSLWKWKKYIAIAVSAGMLVVACLLIYNHPKVMGQGNDLSKDVRLVIWKQAMEMIAERPLLGYGPSTAAERFIDKNTNNEEIIQVGDQTFLRVVAERRLLGAHAHSQFLQSTMEYGLLGFLLLLFMNISPVIVISKQRRIFALLIVIITGGQLVTDIYISSVPLLTYTLLMTVFFSTAKSNKPEENKKILP